MKERGRETDGDRIKENKDKMLTIGISKCMTENNHDFCDFP